VRALAPQIPVTEEAVRSGLTTVHWPGRLQLMVLPTGKQILLDRAHNVGGAEILAAALRQHFTKRKITLILGILQDKDLAGMCEILAPQAARIFLVPVQSERTASPHQLAGICQQANPKAEVREFPSLAAALPEAENDKFVVLAGSLYLVGEAMELIRLSPR